MLHYNYRSHYMCKHLFQNQRDGIIVNSLMTLNHVIEYIFTPQVNENLLKMAERDPFFFFQVVFKRSQQPSSLIIHTFLYHKEQTPSVIYGCCLG